MNKSIVSCFIGSLLILFCDINLYAQADERAVGIELQAPIKKVQSITSNDLVLGGRFHLPMSDNLSIRIKADFQNAIQSFINPTDQISMSGEAWVYFTPKPADTNKKWVRPFVFGGMQQNFLIGTKDATQGFGGFGINVSTAGGTRIIPKFRFTSKNLGGNQTVFGEEYNVSTEIQFDLGKSGFVAGFEPFVERIDPFDNDFYTTRYGISLVIWRKF